MKLVISFLIHFEPVTTSEFASLREAGTNQSIVHAFELREETGATRGNHVSHILSFLCLPYYNFVAQGTCSEGAA